MEMLVVLLGALGVLEFVTPFEARSKVITHVVHLCAFLGIDVNIKDNRGLTALDTVRELPSQKSQQIAALIEGISPSPCLGDQGTCWPNHGICIWCSSFCLSMQIT